MSKKVRMFQVFQEAKESNIQYFAYLYSNGEVIINKMENLDKKMEYIDLVYDHDLRLKKAEHIEIVGYYCADDYKSIERALL